MDNFVINQHLMNNKPIEAGVFGNLKLMKLILLSFQL